MKELQGSPRLIVGAAAFFLFLMSLSPASADFHRATLDLSGAWELAETRDASDVPPASGWQPCSVPGVVRGSGEGDPRFAWYRRQIRIPAEWRDSRIFLKLGGARWDARVYLDGKLLASRIEGFIPLEVELTGAAEPGRAHELAVRCRDWSAAFANGFRLPEQVKGDLRYAPQGKVLYPIGGRFFEFGLWDDVALEARPKVHLRGEHAATSVRKKTIQLEGNVSGQRGSLWVEAKVLSAGEVALSLPGAFTEPDGSWRLGARFLNPRFWSPEDPFLYRLRVSLHERQGGPAIDSTEIKFGFRELWTEGQDFYFNGVKRHLLATSGWPSPQALSRDQVRQVLEQVKAGNNVAIRFHTQPWRKLWVELADEVGVMTIMEGAFWCDSGGSYAYLDDRFWANYREHLRGMVERDRNNASLVMWSLENELLHCGCAKFDPDSEKKLAELGVFVKEIDPEHLITYESDHDPGRVADVIGLHYPHELPDYHDFPNTCDWLETEVKTGTAGGLLGSWGAVFQWDGKKPLYIGEYLWVPTADGSPGTVFFGDEAYLDRRLYTQRAKALAWRDQTVAYRRAGVSGLCPWTEFESGKARFPLDLNPEENILYQAQKWAYEPVAAYLKERDNRFFAGERIVRRFDVFNDGTTKLDLELHWRLGDSGESGVKGLSLVPAGHAEIPIKIRLPETESRRFMPLEVELNSGGRTLHRFSCETSVEPRRSLRVPAGAAILLYDPAGKWGRIARREGLPVRPVESLVELKGAEPARELLVLAPGSLGLGAKAAVPRLGKDEAETAALHAFLKKGGKALVLEQEALEGLGLGLELVPHASTMTFPLAPAHPALAGMRSDDWKFWAPGHYVSRREIRRPAAGGARALVVSGGKSGIDQAPIVEVPVGKGTLLAVQAMVGEKIQTEPAARVFFEDALNYLAGYRPAAGRTVVISQDAGFKERLDEIGLDYASPTRFLIHEDLAGTSLLILHGGGKAVEASLAAVSDLLAAGDSGRIVYWHAPDPDLFLRLSGKFAKNLKIEAASGPLSGLKPDHPVLAGVAREDLDFRGSPRGPDWMRASDPDPAIIESALKAESGQAGVELLAVPGGLAAIRTAGGLLVADFIRWDADSSNALKGKRYASVMLRNLGASFKSSFLGGLWIQAASFIGIDPSPYFSNRGGQLSFLTSGKAKTQFECVAAGEYAVYIRGRSTPAQGGYGIAALKIDGESIGEVEVRSESVREFRLPSRVEIGRGRHELTVEFTNDLYVEPEDRNLFISAIGFAKED